MSFPNKKDREACWGSRDEYWKCLDEKSESDCKDVRQAYEKFCPALWVSLRKKHIFVNFFYFCNRLKI